MRRRATGGNSIFARSGHVSRIAYPVIGFDPAGTASGVHHQSEVRTDAGRGHLPGCHGHTTSRRHFVRTREGARADFDRPESLNRRRRRACPGDDEREAQRENNRDGRDKPGHDSGEMVQYASTVGFPALITRTPTRRSPEYSRTISSWSATSPSANSRSGPTMMRFLPELTEINPLWRTAMAARLLIWP